MAGVTGEIRVFSQQKSWPDPRDPRDTGDLLTMCTLELEMACLDHKNTPVDPDPFSSLFIFPHVPSFSTPATGRKALSWMLRFNKPKASTAISA